MTNFALMGGVAGALEGMGEGMDRGFQYRMMIERQKSLERMQGRRLDLEDRRLTQQHEQFNMTGERADMKTATEAGQWADTFEESVRSNQAQEGIAEQTRTDALMGQQATRADERHDQFQDEVKEFLSSGEAQLTGLGENIVKAAAESGMPPEDVLLMLADPSTLVENMPNISEAQKQAIGQFRMLSGNEQKQVYADLQKYLYGVQNIWNGTIGRLPEKDRSPFNLGIMASMFPELHSMFTPPNLTGTQESGYSFGTGDDGG